MGVLMKNAAYLGDFYWAQRESLGRQMGLYYSAASFEISQRGRPLVVHFHSVQDLKKIDQSVVPAFT